MRLPFARRGPCFKPPAYRGFSIIWAYHNIVQAPALATAAAWASQPSRLPLVDAVRGKITGTFG